MAWVAPGRADWSSKFDQPPGGSNPAYLVNGCTLAAQFGCRHAGYAPRFRIWGKWVNDLEDAGAQFQVSTFDDNGLGVPGREVWSPHTFEPVVKGGTIPASCYDVLEIKSPDSASDILDPVHSSPIGVGTEVFECALDVLTNKQRYVVALQAAARGAMKLGEGFHGDNGQPYTGEINLSRQNGNPRRVAGNVRPGAVNFMVGGETSVHGYPEFQSDNRWKLGFDRLMNARYGTIQVYRLDPSTLLQTPLCTAQDSALGRLTSGTPAGKEISRFGGDLAGLGNRTSVSVAEDRAHIFSDVNCVTATICAPDESIVKNSRVIANGDIGSNVAPCKDGFAVRCKPQDESNKRLIYFIDNAGNLLGGVDQADPGVAFHLGRGDGTRLFGHINSPYVYLAGQESDVQTLKVAAVDCRNHAFVAVADLNEKPFAVAQIRLPLIAVMNPFSVSISTNIVFVCKHPKGTGDFPCGALEWDSWTSKPPFLDGHALRLTLESKGMNIVAARGARYVILTPTVYAAELDGFALWKQSRCLTVDIAYVGNASSDDVTPDRAAIDACIEEYAERNHSHTIDVLMIGDVDLVPSGRSTLVTGHPDGHDVDSDHVYEVREDDRFPSLYVGRLSINSRAELQNQLRKIFSYGRAPVGGDWPTRATRAVSSQTDSECFGVCAEFPSKYAKAVEDIVSYGGHISPPVLQTLRAGAASANLTRAVNQDVVDAVTAARGQVLYRGHGDETAWRWRRDGSGTGSGIDFSQGTHLPLPSNTAYPIVYSTACLNSRLRTTDCIAEDWMLSKHGVVAHFGATVESYTHENHERAKGIFRAIYESRVARLGPALTEAERISFNTTGGGTHCDNNTFCHLLLDDPEWTIRRSTVCLWAQVAGRITAWNQGARITVRGLTNKPIALAFVNVKLASGESRNGFTGADGTLDLPHTLPSLITGLDLDADGCWAQSISTRRALHFLNRGPTVFNSRLDGLPGQYHIQRSVNLASWSALLVVTVPSNTNSVEFSNTRSAESGVAGFYRAAPQGPWTQRTLNLERKVA